MKKQPKGTDYRAMSVFTHFYSRPKYRLKIPRTKYFPVPGVDGALVTFALVPPASRPKVRAAGGGVRAAATCSCGRGWQAQTRAPPAPPCPPQVNGSERGFLSLVNKAFSEKRKMIRNSLQPLYSPDQVAQVLTELQLSPMARAQELSLGDFVRFYNRMQAIVVQEALGQELVFEGVEPEL